MEEQRTQQEGFEIVHRELVRAGASDCKILLAHAERDSHFSASGRYAGQLAFHDRGKKNGRGPVIVIPHCTWRFASEESLILIAIHEATHHLLRNGRANGKKYVSHGKKFRRTFRDLCRKRGVPKRLIPRFLKFGDLSSGE